MQNHTFNGSPVSQRDRGAADSSMSSWPAEDYLVHHQPVKSELTASPDLSRLQRLPTPAVPPTTQQSPRPFATGAISSLNNTNTSSHRQDVRSFVNHSASSTSENSSFGQPSTLETAVSSTPHPSQHVVINSNNRLRTSPSKVFVSSSDLAAHYGIPTILPPPPVTTKHRSTPAPQQHQNPILDFNALKNQYLNMLATPATETTTADRQMVATPAPGPSTGAQANDQQLEQLMNYLASPEFKDNPSFGPEFDMNQFLTSPLPDLLEDFDGSPEETPYNDFLTTPVIPNNDHDFFPSGGEYDLSMPIFPDHEQMAAPAKPVEHAIPHLDMDHLFTISPGTPMLDTPSMDAVASLYNTPLLPMSSDFSPATTTTALPGSARRRSTATGTRKGITPDSLVPLDAPTQARKYVTPSATSRKEVPAVFARKRGRSVAFEDEEDELDEKAPGPNATEKEQIEWKRRQNTLAARKSRKRKLEHQQQLENQVKDLTREREVWKTRALTFRQLLVSHGIPFNEFQD